MVITFQKSLRYNTVTKPPRIILPRGKIIGSVRQIKEITKLC